MESGFPGMRDILTTLSTTPTDDSHYNLNLCLQRPPHPPSTPHHPPVLHLKKKKRFWLLPLDYVFRLCQTLHFKLLLVMETGKSGMPVYILYCTCYFLNKHFVTSLASVFIKPADHSKVNEGEKHYCTLNFHFWGLFY